MINPELLAALGRITDEERAMLRGEALDKSIYTDHGGFTIDNKKMLDRGRLIALRPHTRFVEFPSHNHNYIEIMYVLKGGVTHRVGDAQTVTLRQGELLFMSCQTYHSIRRAGEDDLAVNFIVLPQFFDKAYEMLDHDNILSQFIAQNLRGGGGQVSHLHFKVADVRQVQNLVESLMMDVRDSHPGRHRICAITMGLLFLQLLRHTERIEAAGEPDYDAKLAIAVLREVEENYKSASLTALAQRHNQSVYTLSKLVRQMTGKTYKELLQEKRFSKALQLLSGTRLPVAEISVRVGYENTSYFHRRFLERYGVSPAEYRAAQNGK